jgi:hypothetical protein
LEAAARAAGRPGRAHAPDRPRLRGRGRGVLALLTGSSYITGTVIPIDGGQNAGVKPPQMYRPGQPMKAAD